MPRKAKPTLSGAPGQPVSPVPGQMYGAGVEQAQLQAAMPAPQARIQPADGSQAPPPPPGTAQAVPAGMRQGMRGAGVVASQLTDAQRYEQAMAAAKQMSGMGGLLTQGTGRPNEPITAGLSTGPGPGPEAMQVRMGSPVGESWRRLSAMTGDPYFAELARKANL